MVSSIQRCAPAVQVLVSLLSIPGLLSVTLLTEAQEVAADESSTADGKDAQSSQEVHEPPPPGHMPLIGLFRGRHSTGGFAPLGATARSNVQKLLSVDPKERAETGQKLLTFSLPPGAREAIDRSTLTLEERAELYAQQVTGYCSSSEDPKKLKTALTRFPDLPAASTGFSSGGRLSAMSLGASASVAALEDGPILALLDSGIDLDHPYLRNRVHGPGLCFTTTYADLGASCLCRMEVEPASNLSNIEGCWPGPAPANLPTGGAKCDSAMNWCDHGTHTAGLVTRLDGVDGGVGIRILPVQVNSKFANPGFCHDPGPCVLSFESDRIRALHWLFEQANQDGTKVAAVYVGQSAGSYRSTEECRQAHPCMQIAVDNLWSEGIPVIAPVGNDYRRDAIGAPACLENVISVGASQGGDQMAFFTNAAGNRDVPGRRMDVAEHRFFDFVAPGVEVETATPCADGVCRARISGTSMAAAHVAAAWVRLKQICSAEKPEVVLHALRSLSRRKIADLRGDEPAATGIPLVDVSTIDWSTAGQHCENAPNH